MEPLAPGRTVGPFQLIERIGAGGMGEVWRGQRVPDDGESPEVAVKVVAPDRLTDPDARTRFAREVEAAGRIAVPEVAAVIDADPDADQPWLASEFIVGRTLARRVDDEGELLGEALATLALGLARGLDAIHRAGVVHRDLTPGNVVLGPAGPVIVDFGVSRVEDTTTITRAGSLVGTPAWMAPEQLRDDEVSDASDIWAWGAVMAFAATGRAPVAGERTETVIAKVLDGALDLDGLPDWLQPLVVAAMDPVAARRPTADEIIARLDRSGRGAAAGAITRVDPVTQIAPGSTAPTQAASGDATSPVSGAVVNDGRDWRPAVIRIGVLVAGLLVGMVLPILLAVLVFTIGVLAAVALRIWAEERRDGVSPTINAATVLVAMMLLLAASLSSAIGVVLAIIAVIALLALFVAVGGDIG